MRNLIQIHHSGRDNIKKHSFKIHQFGVLAIIFKSRCNNYCLSRGDSYFGLKKDECRCGNAYPPISKKKADSDCKISCPGDSSETCGREWVVWSFQPDWTNRMSTYETTPTTTPSTTATSSTPTTSTSTSTSTRGEYN